MRIPLLLLTAIVVLLVIARPSSASTYPGQAPAAPVVDSLVIRAEGFWRAHGLSACAGGVTAWEADDLTSGDGPAWARGDGTSCEIWAMSDLALEIEISDSLETLIDDCQAITHEVGHAYGLSHSARGVMSVTGEPKRPHGWAPAFCWRWARSNLRAVLRGEGLTEHEVLYEVSYQMFLARD